MFDNVKEWIFHKAVARAVETVVKWGVAYISSPLVIAGLDKMGIHVDPNKFGVWMTGALLFVASYIYHLYIQHKQQIAKVVK